VEWRARGGAHRAARPLRSEAPALPPRKLGTETGAAPWLDIAAQGSDSAQGGPGARPARRRLAPSTASCDLGVGDGSEKPTRLPSGPLAAIPSASTGAAPGPTPPGTSGSPTATGTIPATATATSGSVSRAHDHLDHEGYRPERQRLRSLPPRQGLDHLPEPARAWRRLRRRRHPAPPVLVGPG